MVRVLLPVAVEHRDVHAPVLVARPEVQRVRSVEQVGVEDDRPVLSVGNGDPSRPRTPQIVVDEVGARSVSVGFDFRFGKGRMGDVDSLRRIGAELEFEVKIVVRFSL